MAVVINTSQNVVTVSQAGPTTITVQDVGIQGPRGLPGSGSVADANGLATTGSNTFVGNQSFDGDVSVTGSLTVSGSNTFTVIGPTVLQGSVTVTGGTIVGTIATASYALNAGVTVDTGSLITTASVASNVITFTKGDSSTFNITVDAGSASGGGGDIDTGSFFINATAGNAGTGTTVYTKGDGTTLTTSFGSSYQIVDGVPNVEVIARPNFYIPENLSGAFSPDKNPSYFIQQGGGGSYDTITFYIKDTTTVGWGSMYSGSVLRFKESGSNTDWAYYGVSTIGTNGSSWTQYGTAVKLTNSPQFTGAATASVELFAQAPDSAYRPAFLGSSSYIIYYRTGGTSISNITLGATTMGYATGSTVSGTSPDKSYLYLNSSPASGNAQMLQSGQYVGFSTDNTNWTYYVVLGETYTSIGSGNTWVSIQPVDNVFYAQTGTLIYVGIFNQIPSQPYYRQLSHIQYPITPSGTSDASGSIGDVSYDDSYFYVKTSAGWKRTALSTW